MLSAHSAAALARIDRIDATVARLLAAYSGVPRDRRPGYLEAIWRLQFARGPEVPPRAPSVAGPA